MLICSFLCHPSLCIEFGFEPIFIFIFVISVHASGLNFWWLLTTLSMICTICAHLECCKVFSFGLLPFLVVFLALILCVCIPSCSPSPTVDWITVMLKRSSLMHLAFVLRNKPAFTPFFNIVFFFCPSALQFPALGWFGLLLQYYLVWLCFSFRSLSIILVAASFDKSFYSLIAFCYTRDLVKAINLVYMSSFFVRVLLGSFVVLRSWPKMVRDEDKRGHGSKENW